MNQFITLYVILSGHLKTMQSTHRHTHTHTTHKETTVTDLSLKKMATDKLLINYFKITYNIMLWQVKIVYLKTTTNKPKSIVFSAVKMAWEQTWKDPVAMVRNSKTRKRVVLPLPLCLPALSLLTRWGLFHVSVVDKGSCESSTRLGALPTHSLSLFSFSSSDFSTLLFPPFLYFSAFPSEDPN